MKDAVAASVFLLLLLFGLPWLTAAPSPEEGMGELPQPGEITILDDYVPPETTEETTAE